MQKILSSSQDYLEAILDLSEESPNVKSVDVAKKLDVSRASVNRAVNLLKEQGYITQEKYGDIFLTDAGIQEGKKIRETHDILQCFFIDVLGVSPDIAEEDACMIEHCISEETKQKLKLLVQNYKK